MFRRFLNNTIFTTLIKDDGSNSQSRLLYQPQNYNGGSSAMIGTALDYHNFKKYLKIYCIS